MHDYAPSACGQGHVTHFYILLLILVTNFIRHCMEWGIKSFVQMNIEFGVDEARHFKFGFKIEDKEYWHHTC